MRSLLAITRKDLRLRLRDRSVLITGILAPLVLALIFNFVFGSAFEGDADFEPSYGVVANEDGQTARVLARIAASIGSEPQRFSSVSDAEEAVDAGDLDAVFVIPDGFDESIQTGGGGELEVIGNVDSPTATQIAAAIASGYGLGLERVQLSIAAGVAAGGDPGTLVPAAIEGQNASPVSIGNIEAAIRQLDGTTYAIAGMAVFFLMFTAQFGFRSLLDERRDGTLARILATPTSPGSVLGAKTLVSFLLGLMSLTVLLIAGSVLMGAEWGDPLAVGALVLAAVAAAVSISAIVSGFAKTPESAENQHAVVSVVLGMLGGTFFPIGQEGGVLSTLTELTPHHWFLRGLANVAGGGGLAEALPAVGWLAVMTVLLGSVAAWVMSRQVWK
ncbi:MAG TPA: ABC transporter permease [Acidimicrobiia bacterium]|nr:ABC transporter permease [Acidimicrobiia bacterium]